MIRRGILAVLGTETGRRALATTVTAGVSATGRGARAVVRAARPDVNNPRRTAVAGVVVGLVAMLITGSLHIGLGVIAGYLIVSGAQRVRLHARPVEDLPETERRTYAPLPARAEARRLDIDSDLTAPAALPERRTR
ncbi:MAG: hypothetical protein ACTMKY_00835 [Dermabacteraceae bacterium]|uniref:hypothetical protein n=1 Tax=Brachybacterium tyrofermentans TaxID=47848 RepID=UPI003FBA5D6D